MALVSVGIAAEVKLIINEDLKEFVLRHSLEKTLFFFHQIGLVECYMSAKRHKEALAVAKNAHKTLGANPRTLTVR